MLAPHRASYDLQLGVTRGAKSVAAADGRIAFEFTGDACTGYAMNFRQVTRIDDGEGSKKLSDLRNTSWEDGQGKVFRFSIVGYTDGEITQQSEGRADRGRKGDVAVKLARPANTKLDFDDSFVFPSQHMRKLIEAARAGDHIKEIKFYDGSDGGQKVFDTLAVIGKEVPAGSEDGLEDVAKAAGLAAYRRWPVKLSYFEPGQGERTPLYVLGFDMFENGVSGHMVLDFGDFTLTSKMRSLDMLKTAACGK